MSEQNEPYWTLKAGVAPIKSEYVLWDKFKQPTNNRELTVTEAVKATELAPETTETAEANGDAEQPDAKKPRLKKSEKKAIARAKREEEWQTKKEAKRLQKEQEKADGGRTKQNGQNKGRKFDCKAGILIRLCHNTARFEVCPNVNAPRPCKNSHDLKEFIETREADIPIRVPINNDNLEETSTVNRVCPMFETTGNCTFGIKCRFADSHLEKLADGEGFQRSGYKLVVDEEKQAEWQKTKNPSTNERGELNIVGNEQLKAVRVSGTRAERCPLSAEYLISIGETFDSRENRGTKRPNNRNEEKSEAQIAQEIEEEAEKAADKQLKMDLDSRGQVDFARYRASEKKRLDWRGKLYMAPLTTVGNLPFRRLAGDFGNDIFCSEMGLAQEFLSANGNEWSLVRRHSSEKTFGVQVCGSRPQVLVPCAEEIVKACPDIDFVDVNCGCPIDLVFNKGAGSALLGHATRLGKSLVGMSKVLGEVPLTIKIRTGISSTKPVAHQLIPKAQFEWGVSALTLHGRSRQQRYKSVADYAYIGQCVKTLRETAEEEGIPAMPIFGNGDAYDYRTYYSNMEMADVDGIMIARGALVKPWIFTEIKERRDWDISSKERLEMIGKLAKYGLEHWGSDTQGINTTRRFLLESLSFQCRYVPVGLLERLPATLNERPYPYRGRDEIETLLASDNSADWIKISNMFLGPPAEGWSFQPKHKSNAYGDSETQG